MKKNKLVIFSVLSVLVLVSSCKRYDEGPGLSLRFKETRIAGVWLFKEFTIDGVSAVDSGWVNDSLSYVEFSKGGIYEVVNDHPTALGKESGVWHMGKGWKGKDYMEVDKNDRVVNFYIIKLHNDNIKYYFDDVDSEGDLHRYEVNLIPKIL